MTMANNVRTQKMAVILDQLETASNSTSQEVFHVIGLHPQEQCVNHQNLNGLLSNKADKVVDVGMNELIKSNVGKNCFSPKKILEEGLKKYAHNLVSPEYIYISNDALNYNGSENQHEKEAPVSLKVDHKKFKKRRLRERLQEQVATHSESIQVRESVEEIFGENQNKDDCNRRGKMGRFKKKEKLTPVKKYYRPIAPLPTVCEPQGMTGEKSVHKITDYSLNSSGHETQKEYENQHLKISDEPEKCMKLQDYSCYNYGKRNGDMFIQPNLISDFESYNKEVEVNDVKNKNSNDVKLKCFKCFNCSFLSLNVDCLNYHTEKKDKCFNNNETFHCPGCKNVFYSLIPLRVHLLYDHYMLQREVKLILQNIEGVNNETDITREKMPYAYDSQNEIIPGQEGNLFHNGEMSVQDMQRRESITKGNFVDMQPERSITEGRNLEPCLSTKRQTMLETYLDDISNKGDCSLPPSLTQNGSDLLENTFNFTAPVSEQLPSIQPPPAHSSSNNLMEHQHLIVSQEESPSFVEVPNVYPEHPVEGTYKPNEGNHYGEDSSLMLTNGNYLPHQIHDIPVINLDENHLAKPSENILSQDINMDDFPSYNENGLQSLDDDENECQLSEKDEDQEEKKKLKKLGVGYRCDINGCKVRLQSEKNIQYHRRCHEGNLYNCPECCKDCSTWVSLSSHLWQAHKIDMELYKCDQCSYKTPSYSRLTNIHRGIHGKARPFLCDVCGKGFKTAKQMRNHKNIHKAKMVRMSNVYHCDICGRSIADKRQLELHINNTHKKTKPYLCNICGYATGLKHSLVLHMRRHTGEKPYECEKCDYKTADHNALRRHKMKHTGVKNYKCIYCPYTCIQASTYKVHIRTKHPGMEGDVIFACDQCNFHSLNRGSWLSHTSEHENYNSNMREETRRRTEKQGNETGGEYYGENNRMDLVGPIITERVAETFRDLSGAQTLLEDDYYERITDGLESTHDIKLKTSAIT